MRLFEHQGHQSRESNEQDYSCTPGALPSGASMPYWLLCIGASSAVRQGVFGHQGACGTVSAIGLNEMRSPGFIDYFIIGEHFKRYLDSSWSGDKYGFPKQQPLGMVWLFLIGAVLPWLGRFFKVVKTHRKTVFKDRWALYLLLWLLWTPLFFTSSKRAFMHFDV